MLEGNAGTGGEYSDTGGVLVLRSGRSVGTVIAVAAGTVVGIAGGGRVGRGGLLDSLMGRWGELREPGRGGRIGLDGGDGRSLFRVRTLAESRDLYSASPSLSISSSSESNRRGAVDPVKAS